MKLDEASLLFRTRQWDSELHQHHQSESNIIVSQYFQQLVASTQVDFHLWSSYNYEQSQTIHSALQRMFPEASLSNHGLQPLTWSVVINDFLFPEIASLLIQEECQISSTEAEELLGFKKFLRRKVCLACCILYDMVRFITIIDSKT